MPGRRARPRVGKDSGRIRQGEAPASVRRACRDPAYDACANCVTQRTRTRSLAHRRSQGREHARMPRSAARSGARALGDARTLARVTQSYARRSETGPGDEAHLGGPVTWL